MNWNESPDFQKLTAEYTDLTQNDGHRKNFEAYLARAWTVPETYTGLLQAYLEFLTPEKPQFRRLNSQAFQQQQQQQRKRSGSRRSRRRRGGRRRRRKTDSQPRK